MAETATVYVGAAQTRGGTLGGVFRHTGKGGWEQLRNGLPEDAQVHAITVHPQDTATVFAGTTKGLFRSDDRGDHWRRVSLPDAEVDIWSVLVHPTDPRRLFAGASPVAVYRSDDAGESWRRCADPGLPNRVAMSFACRVMRLAVDPAHPDDIYATMEANGAMRSRDGGASWEDCAGDLIRFAEDDRYKSRIVSDTEVEGMLDGHALVVSAAAPGTVFLANRMGLFRSDDQGSNWRDVEIGRFSPLTYGRDIRVSPQDPSVMYACLSPAAQSTDGSIYRTEDVGRTWKRFDHGVKAEATMMGVALHPKDPNQVYGVSRVGQLFGTTDGGRTWQEHRLPEGCRDVYAVACG